MEGPLVSIVVISYNQSSFIKECLDSLKYQSYSNIELILADDASSDDSVRVFNNWLQSNSCDAKCVFNEFNIGLSATLNKCITRVTGRYVKFLAADDFLHTDSLLETVNFLENNSDRFGMVFSDIFFVDNNSDIQADKVDFSRLGHIPSEQFSKELLKGNRIAALSVLIKKSVLLETGEYDNSFIVEDYYRWLKVAENYLIGYIPKKLAYYRLHETNISKVKEVLIKEETIVLQIRFDSFGYAKDVINKEVYEMVIAGNLTKRLKDVFFNYSYGSFRVKLYCSIPFIGKLLALKNKLLFLVKSKTMVL